MNYNFFFFLDIKFVERDKFVKVLKNGSILESSRSSEILKKKKKGMEIIIFFYTNIWTDGMTRLWKWSVIEILSK